VRKIFNAAINEWLVCFQERYASEIYEHRSLFSEQIAAGISPSLLVTFIFIQEKCLCMDFVGGGGGGEERERERERKGPIFDIALEIRECTSISDVMRISE